MEIKFDVQMDEKTMYNFLLFHSYSNVVVLIGNIFGLLLAIMGVTSWNTDTSRAVLYLIFGLGMVIYTPFSLKLSDVSFDCDLRTTVRSAIMIFLISLILSE